VQRHPYQRRQIGFVAVFLCHEKIIFLAADNYHVAKNLKISQKNFTRNHSQVLDILNG